MPALRSRSLAAWRRQAVQRMGATRRATLAFLARLPEREILRPRTQDRWSVKDVLAHLLSCDEETIRRFRLIGRGRGNRIHWFESVADIDRFNARDRKSTRLNSSHLVISYAVFCLKKKKNRPGPSRPSSIPETR